MITPRIGVQIAKLVHDASAAIALLFALMVVDTENVNHFMSDKGRVALDIAVVELDNRPAAGFLRPAILLDDVFARDREEETTGRAFYLFIGLLEVCRDVTLRAI